MENLKHIKKIKNSILFSVVWRVLFIALYPILSGIGLNMIGINLSAGILFALSFIVSMIACLTLVTHMGNLIGIREFLRQYKLIERELIGRYSLDAKVLDDMLDNTRKKYSHQISFDRKYDINDLHAIEELNKEDRKGKYLDKYLTAKHDKHVIRMALIPKNIAEDCIYRVFNSKTLFGITGRKYFYKWEMARLDDEFILMRKEKEAKKNNIN
ncbi:MULTISPECIES: hypothetical protein [Bacillus amyloliquefaciens group]|uniref:Uncharacterized protein n=1 Tax=Bacillus velezensis TaxID=492670 RepID=A0ABC8DFG6_BACVE|nr:MULTISPECIES: hypothetical protein [Bacillus amyloliquefaciens group]AVI31052.1 hypothetical protein C3Z10_21895 [Bacillus velezensis]AWX74604.1 hypothetical protein BVDSYZ_21405 [Bacillus velezensis]MDK2561823.1 hypothetical protein [Bacillus amyloliquefaciens]